MPCIEGVSHLIITTMAVIANMWLRGAKKRLGGTVLYNQRGRTLQRELAPEVSNPRTPAQMSTRVKWANLVNFYRANRFWMTRAFENKKQTQSDYNKFMSLNVSMSRIYLTKDEAAAASCVCYPYQVSDGSLQQIEVYVSGQNWVTNLYTGEVTEITDTTTVGEFSQALLGANPGLMSRDQISFIRCTQLTNNNTANPYIQVRAYEMLLDISSTELVKDYMPLDLLTVLQVQGMNAVGVHPAGKMGGFAIIVSRSQGGRILVSPSYLTMVDMDSMISDYSSAAQLDKAMNSYGVKESIFLSSDNADPTTTPANTLSLMAVRFATNGQWYYAGATVPGGVSVADGGLAFQFNQDVAGTASAASIKGGGINISVSTGLTASGPVVTAAGTYNVPSTSGGGTITASVVVGGVTYSIQLKAKGSSSGSGDEGDLS